MYCQIINSTLPSFEKKIMKKYLHCICTRMYRNSVAANQAFESTNFLKDREIENLLELLMTLRLGRVFYLSKLGRIPDLNQMLKSWQNMAYNIHTDFSFLHVSFVY